MFSQISDIFMSLDNTGDRIIEFDEFKVSGKPLLLKDR